jgi:hypothetical protein
VSEEEAEKVIEITREEEDESDLPREVKIALDIVRQHCANPDKIRKLRLEREALKEELHILKPRVRELNFQRRVQPDPDPVEINGDIDNLPPEIKIAVELIRNHVRSDEVAIKIRAEKEAIEQELEGLGEKIGKLQKREGQIDDELEILESRAGLFDKIEKGED